MNSNGAVLAFPYINLYCPAGKVGIGDIGGVNNGTKFYVDDTDTKFVFDNGTAVTSFRGYTTSAGVPTTTELPNDKDWCFHNDTGSVEKSIAINIGGTIYGIVLPAV
jgi:hypothetical protein